MKRRLGRPGQQFDFAVAQQNGVLDRLLQVLYRLNHSSSAL
ncbi:MAG TPA: hypothetical protein VE109_13400 [Acidobacteriaceae bacterium]|nr:hypothetical protein [Acidobacteriaceae bacterium]